MLHRMGRRLSSKLFTVIVLLVLFALATVAGRFQTNQQETVPLTEAEKYVLSRLQSGGKADLSNLAAEKRVIRASFLGHLLTNSLRNLKLGSSGVHIKGAVIDGPLELSNEKIPYPVSLVGCDFKGLVAFFHVSAAGDINFSNSFNTFETKDRRKTADPGTVFEDQALFINVSIDGDLDADMSLFKWRSPSSRSDCQELSSRCDAADFEELKITGDAYFDRATFDGPADFEGAHFSQVLFARDAHFNDAVNLVDIRVTDDIDFSAATFNSSANFSRAKIENQFEIEDVVFNDPGNKVNLQDLQVGQLTLNNKTIFKGQPRIGGLTYQRIAASTPENDEGAWEFWLSVLDKTEYRVDAYTTLEEFVKKQGHPRHADEIYISQRDRRADEAYKKSWWRGVWLWCWDFFLKWTVGYGRRPWLALIYSIVIIVIGCFVFSPERMTIQEKNENPRDYNRFWYSFDLYLPVVELQSGKFWMPKPNQVKCWHYLHIHALLGWVLVPVGLAALTGIIQ